MQASATATALEPIHQTEAWSLARRIAFRLCFLYFTLYCLTNQILGGLFPIPGIDIPELDSLPPIRPLVIWTAAHVFHSTITYHPSGSGDKAFDWVLSFCFLALAALGAVAWFIIARKRTGHPALFRWFHLAMRLALASELILYGMVKAVPLQMPFPFLDRLVEPYGNFSPMGVLWSSVGASPWYETFVGSAELLAGILLLIPRTATLGALIALADMTMVFTLNMTYDVPVKLLSFHLILLSVFLLAPDLPRLIRFFFLNRETAPRDSSLFPSPRANRIGVAAQVTFCVLLLAANGWGARKSYFEYGAGRPKSPLYGIWNVRASSNPDWRRMIFDFATSLTVQKTDDTTSRFVATFNTNAGSFTVNGRSKGELHYQRTSPTALHITGALDNKPVDVSLERLDETKLPLVRRPFHWIQENPVNR